MISKSRQRFCSRGFSRSRPTRSGSRSGRATTPKATSGRDLEREDLTIVVKIAITQGAFGAIAATLPPGSVSFENAIDENGDRLIWLERRWADRLTSYRRAGERTSFCGLWRRNDG